MTFDTSLTVSRRQFVGAAATTSAALVTGMSVLGSCGDGTTGPSENPARSTLPTPVAMSGSGALVAASGMARIRQGQTVSAWLLNGSLPSPTIRVRRGDLAQLQLVNQLTATTILHWHGLIVPADADGHPRDIIAPGAQYTYAFPIAQRAATCWYHPHAHHQTAEQVHRGIAGFFLITDAEEDALNLPTGSREVLLLLQDRDDADSAPYEYAPVPADHRTGMLRGVAYGNGVPLPTAYLPPGRCRLRIVNASHARVYRVAFGDGTPLTIIGNDGGLLPAPVTTDSAWLGVGERIDCLVDVSALRVGSRAMLRSIPYDIAASVSGVHPQGVPMDLLELVRLPGDAPQSLPLPQVLSTIAPLPPAATTRTFVFSSGTGDEAHRINGNTYDIGRSDVQVPLGQVERWVFQNDSDLPHPVHLHGTQFQVESRTGGRNEMFGYELGWKDTVLVMPLEIVAVRVRFSAYAGTYLLHCHNLQHEDTGMMLNVDVT